MTQSYLAFLIDLDDTIFDEVSYSLSGYRAIAYFLAKQTGLIEDDLYIYMAHEALRSGRGNLFNKVIVKFDITDIDVRDLVVVYREHKPSLVAYPDAMQTLRYLRSLAPLAIVTDGSPQIQRLKIAALGLEKEVDEIVFTWECENPKPAPDGIREAARRLNVELSQCLIIGDDPIHDVKPALSAGAVAARVMTGRLSRLASPFTSDKYLEFDSFADLEQALKR